MNLQEIEKLLGKYFEGETSLLEEQRLRDFFASGEVPERWYNLRTYFTGIEKEQEIRLTDTGFDEKIKSLPKDDVVAPLIDLHRPWIYWIAGVAASVLILAAVFVKFDPFGKRIEDTYKDPQTAYVEARKILLYVSAQFNKGTRNLNPVKALDIGLTELKPVASYDKSIKEVSRLDNVDKVESLIIKN